MRGLYAIVDVTALAARRLPVLDVARAIANAQPAAMQLRAKELAARETLQLLRALHEICAPAGIPLFANDRPDLALLAGCEGVHVGQDDVPVSMVRRMAPGLRIGVSTHNLAQVEEALADRPDYVAFGPVFETRSKARPDQLVGIHALRAVAERCPLPVVAIGGIDLGRAGEVGRATHLGAVIAALVPDETREGDWSAITERARALHRALAGD